MLWATLASILGFIILLGGAFKAMPSVWSFIRAAAKAPAMVERMYDEFSPNTGTSMRDAIDRIEAWQDSHAAEDITQFEDIAAKALETNDYLHTRMHDLLNALTPIIASIPLQSERLARIEVHLGLPHYDLAVSDNPKEST